MRAQFIVFLGFVTLAFGACGAPARVGDSTPCQPRAEANVASASSIASSTSAPKSPAAIQYGNPATPPPEVKISPDWIEHRVANAHPSAAYAWVNVVLEVTGREVVQVGARPTVISRQMAIPITAMYH